MRWRVVPHAIYATGMQAGVLFIFQTPKSQKKSLYCGIFLTYHNM
jgi:hypothetical protein